MRRRLLLPFADHLIGQLAHKLLEMIEFEHQPERPALVMLEKQYHRPDEAIVPQVWRRDQQMALQRLWSDVPRR